MTVRTQARTRRARTTLGAGILLVAAVGIPGAAMAQASAEVLPSWEQRRLFLRSHGPVPGPILDPPRILSGQDDIDVLDYDVAIWLDTVNLRIEGTVTVTFKPAPGVASVDEVVLDLDDSMTVLPSVRQRDSPGWRDFDRGPDELRIQLDPPVAAGAISAVTLTYKGAPDQSDGKGLQFSYSPGMSIITGPNVFSLSQPHHARRWWPCKDRSDDKAAVTMRVTAPEIMTVVGNGSFVSRLPASRDEHAVTVWRESRPIATYLVSITAGVYADPEASGLSWAHASHADPSITMPIRIWSFPDRVEHARGSWDVLPEMLGAMEESFGAYPFLSDKYAHVMIRPLRGGPDYLYTAMENQTASSFSFLLADRGDRFEHVVAHELAHHWWGNSVGIRDDESLWLSEGFATYAEVLWAERGRGFSSYLSGMEGLDALPRDGEFPGTVHDFIDEDGDGWPDGEDGRAEQTVYYKGAWVLHMLRWVLAQPTATTGPEPLEQLLRAWSARFEQSTATTADFADFASRHAEDLGVRGGLERFFEQWLHREGRPCYEVGWSAAPQPNGGYAVYVQVEQKSIGVDLDTGAVGCEVPLDRAYEMPVAVRLIVPDADGDMVPEHFDQIVTSDRLVQMHAFLTDEVPLDVAWDPSGWILKKVERVDIDRDDDGWPDAVDGCPDVSNPAQDDLDESGVQDACEPGLDLDGDGVPYEDDCAPGDPGAWDAPEDRDATLLVSKLPGGDIELRWDIARGGAGPDVSAHVVQGRLDRLRANEGRYDDGSCVASGDRVGSAQVGAADAWGDRYFTVIPWNGCSGPTPAGTPIDPCP